LTPRRHTVCAVAAKKEKHELFGKGAVFKLAKKEKEKEKEKAINTPEADAEETEKKAAFEEGDKAGGETVGEPDAEELLNKLACANDKIMRLAAEYDNYRKRTSKEKEELYAASKLSVISEFLPVIDNLDRALSNKSDNLDEYKKGVEMIGNQFYETFKKLGAEEFGRPGDIFDPEIHNAVMHTDDEDLGENMISAVFTKGYKVGDKVIRHAVVQVVN
jgi:molecular chaperone GrpE